MMKSIRLPAKTALTAPTYREKACKEIKEMVAAANKSGLWLLRPGSDPRAEWSIESIDRNSGGFEHAAILTDLDGDGVDELYVACAQLWLANAGRHDLAFGRGLDSGGSAAPGLRRAFRGAR